MKVSIRFSGPKYEPGDEYQATCEVSVDGKNVASAENFSDCPEDANLGRDLNFVYGLPAALQAAHDAGKRGESFELEEVEHAYD